MLIHISTNVSLKKKTFIPKVPPYRIGGEDYWIKRICFSTNVKNCITSFPYKSGLISHLCSRPVYLTVYELEESELSEQHVRTPEQIQLLVPDAVANEEYWVTKAVTLNPSLIRIKKLRLEHFCKYTGDWSGSVTELEYEKDVEDHERIEKATFYNKKHFREFKKACEQSGIILQKVVSTKEPMLYRGYIRSSRDFNVTRVTYQIPSGVSAQRAWEVIAKELKKNRRRHLCYNNRVDIDDFK